MANNPVAPGPPWQSQPVPIYSGGYPPNQPTQSMAPIPVSSMAPGMPYPSISSPVPVQSAQPQVKTFEFVQGKHAAESFPQPAWLPPNQVIPLWDSTENVIWFKSWSPIGMAYPLVRVPYTMEAPSYENMLPVGNGNGSQQQPQGDFLTKADFEQRWNALMAMMQQNQPHIQPQQIQNQNGTQQMNQGNQQGNNNRGGGRNG